MVGNRGFLLGMEEQDHASDIMIGKIKDLDKIVVNHPSAANAAMKVLVGPQEGWDGYVMRVVEVEEGGYTPKHSHPWPHINYFIEGKGELMINGKVEPVEAGSFAFVPNDRGLSGRKMLENKDPTFFPIG